VHRILRKKVSDDKMSEESENEPMNTNIESKDGVQIIFISDAAATVETATSDAEEGSPNSSKLSRTSRSTISDHILKPTLSHLAAMAEFERQKFEITDEQDPWW